MGCSPALLLFIRDDRAHLGGVLCTCLKMQRLERKVLGGDVRLCFLLPGVAVLIPLHQVFKKQRALYWEIKSTNFRRFYNRPFLCFSIGGSCLRLGRWDVGRCSCSLSKCYENKHTMPWGRTRSHLPALRPSAVVALPTLLFPRCCFANHKN